jgi:hypothetical protein
LASTLARSTASHPSTGAARAWCHRQLGVAKVAECPDPTARPAHGPVEPWVHRGGTAPRRREPTPGGVSYHQQSGRAHPTTPPGLGPNRPSGRRAESVSHHPPAQGG